MGLNDGLCNVNNSLLRPYVLPATEIKIGMTMEQLKAAAKNSTPAVQQSVFNYIKDEQGCGDGKITNEVELAILTGLLNNKSIEMPDEVQADEEGAKVKFSNTDLTTTVEVTKIINSNESEQFKFTQGIGKMKSLKEKLYTHVLDTGKGNRVNDYILDYNHDGIADERELIKDSDGKKVVYHDSEPFDGQFESKAVYDGENEIRYNRDEQGKWIME